MMRIILITHLLLLMPAIATSSATPMIAASISEHQIVIIGEIHHHTDSANWFLTTVSNYVKNGKCLNVALEINSSQQPVMNAVMKGVASVSSIRINSIIDHPAYRQMLAGFSNLIMDGSCLSVYAIDAPQSAHINRDEWMAKQISDIGEDATIIALLGNLHALKHVDWYQEAKGKPFLAGRLQSMGMEVFSAIQDWPLGGCSARHAKLVTADSPEGHDALGHILNPVAANLPENPKTAIDMAIVWDCQ